MIIIVSGMHSITSDSILGNCTETFMKYIFSKMLKAMTKAVESPWVEYNMVVVAGRVTTELDG